MSEPHPAHPEGAPPETSVDDILASIRRILSEEETSVSDPAPQHRAHDPLPDHGRDRAHADDVLDLDPGMMTAPPTHDPVPPHDAPLHDAPLHDAPLHDAPPHDAPPHDAPPHDATQEVHTMSEHEHDPAPAVPPAHNGLVAPAAADAAASSVGDLVRMLTAERHAGVGRSGLTIEDLVREEVRPVLKQWLDAHLPPIVERLVRAEIERVVARASL